MNEPSLGDDGEVHSTDNEALSIVSYRIEWNMRHALKPTYETLFEMLKYSSWRVAFFCPSYVLIFISHTTDVAYSCFFKA